MLLIVGLLIWSAGSFAAGVPPWLGIWHGTLGKQEVMVCLADESAMGGSTYYYVKYQSSIPLTSETPQSGHWQEGNRDKPSGIWQLGAVQGDSLSGQWSAPGKAGKLPIALKRIAALGQDQYAACEVPAFFAPRDAKFQVMSGKAHVVDGKAYTEIQVKGRDLASLWLSGATAQIASINANLARQLKRDYWSYFTCLSEGKREALGGDYSSWANVVAWGQRWLVIGTAVDSYCGGAHPNQDLDYQTWDLTTGQMENLWRWFNAKGTTGDKSAMWASPELTKVVLQSVEPRKDECGDDMQSASFYRLRLSRQGMVFIPSLGHADRVCEEEVTVSYKKLLPFLNERGQHELSKLPSAF
ncbi:hypothetical protein [Paludibacterium purpuratum]|nr:hypothetical protein [Paludibacterium purpuratum]